MKSIEEQFAVFLDCAASKGMPRTKESCMRIAFFAGWANCLKDSFTASHLSEVEMERHYKAHQAELGAMFTTENIAVLYGQKKATA